MSGARGRSAAAERALFGALAIMVGGAALGLLVNHFSPRGIPVFARQSGEKPVSLSLPAGLQSMTVEEAYAAWRDQAALFVDARAPQEYREGHIPGAVNLPPDEFEDRYPDLADRVEAAGSAIVYCQGVECGDAVMVAERLAEVYEGSVYVMEEGWEGWTAAGFPVASGERRP